MTRAVIFGGAGFIGSHLARRLSRRGVEVLIADIVPPASKMSGVTYMCSDVRRPIGLPITDYVDQVYNLAAIHRTPGHPDHEYYDTNVSGAINISNWLGRVGANSLLFTSSIAVYGRAEGPTDEYSEVAPLSAYGRSKLQAEQIHDIWYESGAGRRLTVIRPAVVFGSHERGNFARLAAALARKRFAYPGSTDIVKACGYVGDLIAAIEFLESHDLSRSTVNFCYPRPYTIRDICGAFATVAGYREPYVVPAFAVEHALRALEMLGRGTGTFSPDRIRKLTASTYIVPTRLKELGFGWPTNLDGGLKAWLNDEPVGEFA